MNRDKTHVLILFAICVLAMVFIFFFLNRMLSELARPKRAKEPYLDFDDVIGNTDIECETEYCFEYLPKNRKHILKKKRKQKTDTGTCVSNHDDKRYTCMSQEPNYQEMTEKLAELDAKTSCDGNPITYCYSNSDEMNVYHKKFYRREYDPIEGQCVWKDIQTNETVSYTQISLCSKERVQCASRDYACGNSLTRVRHQINPQGECQALNSCDLTCDTSLQATCYNYDPTNRAYHPMIYSYKPNLDTTLNGCEFYNRNNSEMPHQCMYNTILECGDPIVCNGKTYVASSSSGNNVCEYVSDNGEKLKDISECLQTCDSNEYYDYETNSCKTCGVGMFLKNPDEHSFDAACVPYVNCEQEYTPCFEDTDTPGKYLKVLYQKIHDVKTNTCKNAYNLKSPCYSRCTFDVTEENGEDYCIVPNNYELYDIKM